MGLMDILDNAAFVQYRNNGQIKKSNKDKGLNDEVIQNLKCFCELNLLSAILNCSSIRDEFLVLSAVIIK